MRMGLCVAISVSAAAACSGELVAHWRPEPGHSSLVDAGPHGLHGALMGAVVVAEEEGDGGIVGFAVDPARVEFPQSDEYAFDSSESFSVSFRFRTRTSARFQTLLMTKDRPGGTVSYSFCMGRAPGVLSFELWSWQTVRLLSGQSLADGAWHRVTGAYDAATNLAMLVVDDVLVDTAKAGKGGPKTVALRLGDNVDSHQQFAGDIGEVAIRRGIDDHLFTLVERSRRWWLLDREDIEDSQSAYLARMAAPRFTEPDSREAWKRRAGRIRRHVLSCLGLDPLPARVPLDVRTAGQLERETHTVQRIYWQTWPGVYASGYLYMPRPRPTGATPAVLCPHGHWPDGARHPIVQARCINLAARGYVVLAVDSVHAYNWSAGVVPLTVMLWHDIRALDLLAAMPEVDPERLGVTGCSGGGQQTFYLMALEDRLRAAIPVCMVSEWRRILDTRTRHCTCNHVPGILSETDTPEITACFAPRPALLICVTGDWTAWLPREGFPAIRSVYQRLGAESMVRCTQYDCGHEYNREMREEAYAWLNQFLRGQSDPGLSRELAHEPESLQTLASLDDPAPPAFSIGPVVQDTLARRGFNPEPPGPGVAQRLQGIRAQFIDLYRESRIDALGPVRVLTADESVDGCVVDRVIVTTEPDVPLPVVTVRARPQGGQPPRSPAVLLVAGRGKAWWLTARWTWIRQLVAEGWLVCALDPRPFGEHSLNRDAQDMNGVVFGRPELAVAAHDISRVAEWLLGRSDVDPERVACVGVGEGALAALAAGVLENRIRAVAALETGDTYSVRDRRPRAPGILTVADLPQLAACIAPRSVLIQGATQPDAFEWTQQAYGSLGSGGRCDLRRAEPSSRDLATWLGAACTPGLTTSTAAQPRDE